MRKKCQNKKKTKVCRFTQTIVPLISHNYHTQSRNTPGDVAIYGLIRSQRAQINNDDDDVDDDDNGDGDGDDDDDDESCSLAVLGSQTYPLTCFALFYFSLFKHRQSCLHRSRRLPWHQELCSKFLKQRFLLFSAVCITHPLTRTWTHAEE